MQANRRVFAARRSQPAGSTAACAREARFTVARAPRGGDPGFKTIGNPGNAGLGTRFQDCGGRSMGKLTFAAALAVCAAVEIASAEAAVVVVSTTMQAAVNEAKPGDIILVPPGTYRETVRVLKDHITILGSEGAIIDGTGFANGIHVGADIF